MWPFSFHSRGQCTTGRLHKSGIILGIYISYFVLPAVFIPAFQPVTYPSSSLLTDEKVGMDALL